MNFFEEKLKEFKEDATAVELEFNYTLPELEKNVRQTDYQKKIRDARIAELDEYKLLIPEALMYWKFIMNYSAGYEGRSEFLKANQTSDNKYIRLISTIELLPPKIWRKLLWKYNIDFMSFESFLRRIDDKQIKSINDNYDDYANEIMPRAYGKFEIFIKRLTFEKVTTWGYEHFDRYDSKGSLSYNLLNLDFGFNAYPNGVNDDYKIEEISPLRFLSTKNHADDFIVNQEDGKYWSLYVLARSNYVYRPNRRVVLKTHICPGFWYAFMIHLWFWVLSPVAFLFFSANIEEMLLSSYPIGTCILLIVGMILSLLTPLWCIVAAIKKTATSGIIGVGVSYVESKVVSFVRRYDWALTKLVLALKYLVFTAAVLLLSSLIAFLSWQAFSIVSDLVFGYVGAGIIILGFYVLAGNAVYYATKNDSPPDFSDLPLWANVIIGLAIAVVVLTAGIELKDIIFFVVGSVVNFVAWFIVTVIKLVISYAGMITLLCAIVAAPIGLGLLLEKIDDDKWRHYEGIVYLSVAGVFVLGMIGGVIAVVYATVRWLTWGVVASTIMYVAFMCALLYFVNPDTKKYRKLSKGLQEDWGIKLNHYSIRANPWLHSLDNREVNDILEKVGRLLYFDLGGNSKAEVSRIFIEHGTEKKYTRIMESKTDIITSGGTDTIKHIITMMLLEDVEFNDELVERAKEIVEKAREIERNRYVAQRERKEKNSKVGEAIKKFLGKIFYYPKKFLTFIGMLFIKTIEYIKTFYRLYELFNEKCPYVSKSKKLEL